MNQRYMGLMSGTSLDSIDTVLVDFTEHKIAIHSFYQHDFSTLLKNDLQQLIADRQCWLEQLGNTNELFTKECAQAINTHLKKATVAPNEINAIGFPGQTLYHAPNNSLPFCLILGCATTLAHQTQITTVADFRKLDILAGGQGAPLAPFFHAAAFAHPTKKRVIINIGGIANITILNPNKVTKAYDTGPGNALIDAYIQKMKKLPFDKNGAWAKTGTVDNNLLNQLLSDPYFQKPAPKTTGKEYFNLAWLDSFIKNTPHSPENIHATLTQLTAQSIINALHNEYNLDEIFICGGGMNNSTLITMLKGQTRIPLHSTKTLGIDPQQVEACAFAWLAKETINDNSLNASSITGASQHKVGTIYTN